MMKFLIMTILISTIVMSAISPIFAIGDNNTSGHNHDKSKQPNSKPLQHHDKNPISKGGNPDNVKNVNDNTPVTHVSKGSEIPNIDKGNQGLPITTPTNTHDNNPSTVKLPNTPTSTPLHVYYPPGYQEQTGICHIFHTCNHGGNHHDDHHNHDNHNHNHDSHSHNDVEVIHKTVVVHDNNNTPQTILLNTNAQTGTCFITLQQIADIPNAVTQLLNVGCESVTITPS
jgi:hypothetical protein